MNALKSFLSRCCRFVYYRCLSAINGFRFVVLYFCRIFPIKKNRVYFDHFNGAGFGDNPKYIAEALHTLYPQDDIEYIWSYEVADYESKIKGLPQWCKPVNRLTLKGLYYMATARVWLCDSRRQAFIRKRKGQFYIQTWHGGLGLKKIEGDAKCYPPGEIKRSQNDSKMIDLLISNSTHLTNIYKKAFWYSGEIVEIGMANCDKLLNYKIYTYNLREKLCLPPTSKILIYAPTFRDNRDFNFSVDLQSIRSAMQRKFETEDIRILVRLHPRQSFALPQFSFDENIINATDFQDMNELLLDCDYMITDYSSCMFQMSYMHKPVWLYATDIDEYVSKERGFYYELDELPFDVSTSMEELEKSIHSFDEKLYHKQLEDFFARVGLKESGRTSEIIAKMIYEKLN